MKFRLLIICLANFAFNSLFSQTEKIVDFPKGDILVKEYTKEDILQIEKLSDDFSGLKKVESVSADYPDGKLSETETWPEGTWGRGYHTWPNVKLYPKTDYGYYFACHPMIRDISCFFRAHIYLYLKDNSLTTSERLAKAGIDYLLDAQIKKGKQKGHYIWYLQRAGQEDLNMNPPINKEQPYETAYALVALCEYYKSGIDYKRTETYEAILLSTAALEKIKWAKDHRVGNTNMKSLGVWCLKASYEVTESEDTYEKITEIATLMLDAQNIDSTSENGCWNTGSPENISGYMIHHDTKIYYHMMNIRGLIEAFSVVPDSDKEFKWRLADAIKRAVNHVMLYRVDQKNPKNFKLRYLSKTVDGQPTPDWYKLDLVDIDKAFEPIMKLSLISKNSEYFTEQEHISIRNLAYRMAQAFDTKEVWFVYPISLYYYFVAE